MPLVRVGCGCSQVFSLHFYRIPGLQVVTPSPTCTCLFKPPEKKKKKKTCPVVTDFLSHQQGNIRHISKQMEACNVNTVPGVDCRATAAKCRNVTSETSGLRTQSGAMKVIATSHAGERNLFHVTSFQALAFLSSKLPLVTSSLVDHLPQPQQSSVLIENVSLKFGVRSPAASYEVGRPSSFQGGLKGLGGDIHWHHI